MCAAPERTPTSHSNTHEVTNLLRASAQGDEAATNALYRLIATQLRSIAARRLVNESLGPDRKGVTELVDDVFLQLVHRKQVQWADRAHFYRAAATAIHHLLVDHARARGRMKRGGDLEAVREYAESVAEQEAPDALETIVRREDMGVIADAIAQLAALDATQAELIKLRYFTSLTVEEIAEICGMNRATVHRRLRAAEAFLRPRLAELNRG